MSVGAGDLRYEVAEGWEQLPEGWKHRDVVGVAVDSKDRVYVFTRDEHPVIVYERDGRFVGSWGEGQFTPRTHGITIGPDDTVYCVDDGDHSVRVFTTDGQQLMVLGNPGQPSDTGYTGTVDSIERAAGPFNRPTNLSVAPNGELYVSDGYGNARVHRYSKDGALLQSWGQPGGGPGQFRTPHGIWVMPDGRVLVADRENDRVQVFSPTGEYLTEWLDVQRPTQIYERDGLVYVSELWWRKGQKSYRHGPITEDQYGGFSVYDGDGRLLSRARGTEPCASGSFCAPHGIYADSHGDVYVGEVTWTFAAQHGAVPADCHTFQKFVRAR
jgi:DNA-binding beta-propeller fold protein YncE